MNELDPQTHKAIPVLNSGDRVCIGGEIFVCTIAFSGNSSLRPILSLRVHDKEKEKTEGRLYFECDVLLPGSNKYSHPF